MFNNFNSPSAQFQKSKTPQLRYSWFLISCGKWWVWIWNTVLQMMQKFSWKYKPIIISVSWPSFMLILRFQRDFQKCALTHALILIFEADEMVSVKS